MYHCHIRFYLAGHQNQVFEIIKQILPLKHFTHIFSESDQIENTLVTKADVILANLQDMDMKQSLHILLEKKEHTDLILLVEKNQMSFLSEELSKVEDIWILPMEEEEIKFRFLKWQQSCKLKKDFWETCQYFETTINGVLGYVTSENYEPAIINNEYILFLKKYTGDVEAYKGIYSLIKIAYAVSV